MTTYEINALAPLLFGDGRPFGNNSDETRARGAVVPRPSTVAGLLRTHLGNAAGADWDKPEFVAQVKTVAVGPQLLRRTGPDVVGQWVLPAPRDATVVRDHDAGGVAVGGPRLVGLRPYGGPGRGQTDLPVGLMPTLSDSQGKPEPGYGWWTWEMMQRWLLEEIPELEMVMPPPVDERVHNEILRATKTVKPGGIFTVEYRSWEDHRLPDGGVEWSLVVEVNAQPEVHARADGLAHFGGERRPAAIRAVETSLPEPWPELMEALTSTRQLRCVLVTPGLFAAGWRPDLSRIGGHVVAACVGPPEPVSGWDLERGRRGPKPVRRLAPAGSTYFIELDEPLTAEQIADVWLAPLADQEQDRRDGYGSAVWGTWT